MTDNDIKKALECCCNSQGCSKCDFSPKCDGFTSVKLALNYINRLEAENERFKKIKNAYDFAEYRKQEIKAEAYKEFADRLKERMYTVGFDIDELLKEMIGE